MYVLVNKRVDVFLSRRSRKEEKKEVKMKRKKKNLISILKL
jgi:hypothetical protein